MRLYCLCLRRQIKSLSLSRSLSLEGNGGVMTARANGASWGTRSCCDVRSECQSRSCVPTHVVRALQGEALGLVRRDGTGGAAQVGAVRSSRMSWRIRVLQPKKCKRTYPSAGAEGKRPPHTLEKGDKKAGLYPLPNTCSSLSRASSQCHPKGLALG